MCFKAFLLKDQLKLRKYTRSVHNTYDLANPMYVGSHVFSYIFFLKHEVPFWNMEPEDNFQYKLHSGMFHIPEWNSMF